MATWVTLPTLAEKTLLTALHMNNIKNDIDIIRSPALHYYLRGSGDADYTTSSTTYADIDTTNVNATLTLTGNPVRIKFYAGRHNNAATAGEIDLLIDGVSIRAGTPIWRAGAGTPVNLEWVASGLSAGSHTFKLQWRMVGAGAFTLPSANGVWFEVREQ